MRRIFSLILALVMVAALIPVMAFPAVAATSGSAGANVTWSFNSSTGILSFSGTGAMENWFMNVGSSQAPWAAHASVITEVHIANGITTIGNCAFAHHPALTNVSIPGSVTTIGSSAFWSSAALTSLVIPEGVTSIGGSAFTAARGLTSIVIPSTVTFIGNSAFRLCESLTSVIIPHGVTAIRDSTFRDCVSLTSVTIPPSVTSIEDSAFENCTSLTGVIIPDNVTTIGETAFTNSGLTEIIIPPNVTTIGRRAFESCGDLVRAAIPASVTDIGSFPFRYNWSLTEILVDPANPRYSSDSGALIDHEHEMLIQYPAAKTDSTYSIPDGVVLINGNSFEGNPFLTGVIFPGSVTNIGDFAFRNCVSLISVDIPTSMRRIGIAAFLGCSSLVRILIPPTVEIMQTFQTMSSVDIFLGAAPGFAIHGVPGTLAQTYANTWGHNFVPIGLDYITLNVPTATKNRTITVWGFAQPGTVVSIAIDSLGSPVTATADSNFRYTADIILPAIFGTYTITARAVLGGADVLDVKTVFYNDPANITPGAVSRASHTTATVKFTSSHAGSYFYTVVSSGAPVPIIDTSGAGIACDTSEQTINLSGLTTGAYEIYIVVKDTAGNVGEVLRIAIHIAMATGAAGDNITWTLDTTTGGVLAFNGTGAMWNWTSIYNAPPWIAHSFHVKEVQISGGITTIGNTAFSNHSLTNVVIPHGVETIGSMTFNNNNTLTSVVIPNSVKTIGDRAFSFCRNLPGVNIPDSVTEIGRLAFGYCDALTNVVIPDSVITIHDEAFRYSGNLYTVTLESTIPPTVGFFAFSNLASGARAIVPHGATAYGNPGDLWNGLVVVWEVCGDSSCVCSTVTPATDVIIPSTTDDTATINLTAETIHLPDGFTPFFYSTAIGAKWVRWDRLKDQRAVSRLFNRGMTLRIMGRYAGSEDSVTITFPAIAERPKRNAERLVPSYGDTHWVLAKRNTTAAVFTGYEYAPSANGKTPDDGQWFQMPQGGIPIVEGRNRPTFLVRAAPNETTAASVAWRVRPANFSKAPTLSIRQARVNGSADRVSVIAFRKGDQYATGDGTFIPALAAKVTIPVSQLSEQGTELRIRRAATGRRPPSETQTITLPAPAASPS
jgi:hypothetical protein